MTGPLTAVSLFSGCGGFDYGAQSAGLEIVWANDFDAHASAAYRSVFPCVEFHEGDIRTIRSFPKADVLIGCYPCTGFSLAARRKWKDRQARDLKANGDNFLYREFIRALKQVKPLFLFIENVGGMQSAEAGWFFKQQIDGLRKNRYNTYYQTLNAQDYGVAQSRKRMFIVGVHRDLEDFTYEFPLPTHGPNAEKPHQVLKNVIGHMEPWPEGEYLTSPFHGHYLTRNRKRQWDEPSYTIVANAHHVPLHPQGLPMKYLKKDTWMLQGTENRRLSWIECAKVQGLPDLHNPTGTLKDKYRVVGNAVPPLLGQAVVSPVTKHFIKAA